MKTLPSILIIVLSSLSRACDGHGDDSEADSESDDIVVTSSDPQGWVNSRDVSGDGGPCTEAPRAGSGSLCLEIDAPGEGPSPAYAWSLTQDLGLLADLEAVSFDFYREASSASYGHFAPALRLHILEPSTGVSSSLVWEAAYNGYASYADSVPEDTWISEDIGDDFWWQYDGAVVEIFDRQIGDWGYSADAMVTGISVQLGSGWNDSWKGYTDLISVTFAGETSTWNFE